MPQRLHSGLPHQRLVGFAQLLERREQVALARDQIAQLAELSGQARQQLIAQLMAPPDVPLADSAGLEPQLLQLLDSSKCHVVSDRACSQR